MKREETRGSERKEENEGERGVWTTIVDTARRWLGSQSTGQGAGPPGTATCRHRMSARCAEKSLCSIRNTVFPSGIARQLHAGVHSVQCGERHKIDHHLPGCARRALLSTVDSSP